MKATTLCHKTKQHVVLFYQMVFITCFWVADIIWLVWLTATLLIAFDKLLKRDDYNKSKTVDVVPEVPVKCQLDCVILIYSKQSFIMNNDICNFQWYRWNLVNIWRLYQIYQH